MRGANFLKAKTRMTEAEYRANLAGLNTFFGAVLGFVISGVERLQALQFAVVLLLVAGVVISILYINATRRRLLYSLYTLAMIGALPWIVDKVLHGKATLPDKLQPTLLVWAAVTILVEFAPRERATTPTPGPDA